MYKAVPVPDAGIGIWIARLSSLQDHYERLRKVLSREELQRSASFYFERDRLRFILSRGMLRELLGHYLQRSPSGILFSFNAFGKPMISSKGGRQSEFNLSHSGGLVSVIIGDMPVGVDIEHIRPGVDTDSLCRNYFSAEETETYFRTVPDERKALFFRIWTRKEAFMKAVGLGLAIPLKSFSVIGDNITPVCIGEKIYEVGDFRPGEEHYLGSFSRMKVS